MQHPVEIRAPRDDEAPQLSALAGEIWRAHYPGIISVAQIEYMLAERYAAAVIRAELNRDDVWWDALFINGQMTGYTAYFFTATPGTVKIDKLYLHPRAQRQGYGGQLMDHVARRMAAQGCTRLTLAVNRHNKTAIEAYRKHGFAIVDTSFKIIGGGFVMDDYIMVKAVND